MGQQQGTLHLRAPPKSLPRPSRKSPRQFPAGGRSSAAAEVHRISNFGEPEDVDLNAFFRLIHEISGLNVVLDPSVKGTVTLVLDEVPWDQARDIVLRNNGLTEEIDNNDLELRHKIR